MKKWQRTAWIGGLEIGALLVLHQSLLAYLAHTHVVATIFASGKHVPLGTLAVVLLFLSVRLLVILGLPGLILVRLARVLFAVRDERRLPD